MSFANYPAELPLPSQDYSFSPEPVAIRTQMESGRVRQRQAKTGQYYIVSVAWEYSDAELALWNAWFYGLLQRGALPFQCYLTLGGALRLCLVQFAQTPQVSHFANYYWRVSARLQTISFAGEAEDVSDLAAINVILGEVELTVAYTLPPPHISYGFGIDTTTERSTVQGAAYYQRDRFGRATLLPRVTWQLDENEFHLFRIWHRLELGFGTLPFDLDLPFGDGMQANRVKLVDGVYTAQMVSAREWDVSAVLEVEAPVVTSTYSEALSDYEANYSAALSDSSTLTEFHGMPTVIYSRNFEYRGGGSIPLQSATALYSRGFNLVAASRVDLSTTTFNS